ncbi:EscU/YscU/HrcU family type III secretion system export apparatus switch protein [Fictibacillus terranigra]|uniref:EscU/YscU/HrcU family type III secretion system export apparatus switch protein n=1 Tax=Fictibacillus terranigra TaxID=3058424 RepID=A0ABT8E6C1_9BACL|nr:EscU/YscU/HrcU family type III secretion system export apparatus switch protein [Fictibacillus sp. CENA-BCM004]MDN4073455.1 EscU/YscU/HrcU family type III secretion system export apparatus switch protein [Fictibacillus sp. CENA-BCM004]
MNKESKLPRAAALSYRKNMAAPKLTVKGTGKTAEKILSAAQQNNIPIQRDPSLVALLSKLEINEKIPQELYEVAAEIFAFLYHVDQEKR